MDLHGATRRPCRVFTPPPPAPPPEAPCVILAAYGQVGTGRTVEEARTNLMAAIRHYQSN